MGLDMYMYRRPKTMTEAEFDAESDALWEKGIEVWRSDFKGKYQMAYWRKTNWLHGYIVDNFAGGKDECQRIPLSKADVQQILDKVTEVCDLLDGTFLVPQKEIGSDKYRLRVVCADDETKPKVRIEWKDGALQGVDENTAYKVEQKYRPMLDRILPCRGGFFFGSTEYYAWYVYDMFDTRDTLAKMLAAWDDEQQYWYEASW